MRILYFAWLRGKVGTGEEEITPPVGIATVGQLIDWLKTRSPGYAEAFAQPGLIRAAVNQEYAKLDQAVAASDEVAFFPPVTGG
ncbi:molybdopterin converting factor subunit 1 [Telmatospirillum siberiense]|uniref:Molybdopterin synthase sulfur carrier subunit n=1 Tax=Telmatospirillum siberiense TaxID=382514 RepID=A0A2N3PU84_9PROT|nr:molybdopterin converting factor subunit 1 [Telmatospirillum siberiense]PKU23947.1 molybdopterin converting factor subunit 1 [Telmatospirillum siberiense]